MPEPKLMDGKRSLDVELIEYVRGDDYTQALRMSGSRVPMLTDIDMSALPSLAYVNMNRWICACPQQRCPGTSFVWINGPHQFLCSTCGNRGIGGRWRLVIVPDDWQDIEDVLFERFIWHERSWETHQTVDDLLIENIDLGYPIPPYMVDRAESAFATRGAKMAVEAAMQSATEALARQQQEDAAEALAEAVRQNGQE